jgi:hypothetical protein
MFSVTASLGRPALTVASSGRPTGRTSKKGKRFEAKFGAKIKEVKKDLDKMLGDAKESFEKFEKMHKENVDKLGDIANHDIEILKNAFSIDDTAHGSDDDENPDSWFSPVSCDEDTIDVEFVPHPSRGRNDK